MRATRPRATKPRALAAAFALLGGLGAIQACAELTPIASDVCGNHVIDYELGEECDGSVATEVDALCRDAGMSEGCNARCGAPSEPGACRYVADDKTSCPIGWARGSDDICRRPSGKFASQPFARVNSIALDGSIADFDGDGVADLFLVGGEDAPSISYFDGSGAIVATTSVPAVNVTAGFISADRDEDTAADLVVGAGPALTTFRGAPGKELLQKAYAPFENPVQGAQLLSIPVVPINSVMGESEVPPGFDRAVARLVLPNGDVRYQEIEAATLQQGSGDLTFPGLGDSSLGPPVLASLLDDTEPPNPVPDQLEPALEIVEATSTDILIGRFPQAASTPYTISAQGEVFQRLVSVRGGGARGAAVVTLRADGKLYLRVVLPEKRFDQTPGPMAPEMPMLGTAYALPLEVASDLLAVGYLNDDDLPDIVTRTGVRFLVPLPEGGLGFTPEYKSNFEPFDEAIITDLNHDDRREIVTLSQFGDIVVLLPGTSYTYNPVPISVPEKPRNLVTGDFDGDGFEDLLVTSGKTNTCDAEDELYLLFGSASAVPSAPQLIGSLAGIERLIPIRFYFPFQPDGVSDITIQTSCSPTGEDADYVGVFFGNTSRIVSSPFSPYASEFTQDPTIERVAIGNLLPASGATELDAHDDIALVASLERGDFDYYDRELRLVGITGDAEMATAATTIRLVDGEAEDIVDKSRLVDHAPAVVTGPLFDGSPADEIVMLSAYSGLSGTKITLWVAEVDGGEPETVFSQDIDPQGIDDFSVSRLRLFDYDDDGDLDVAAFTLQQRPTGASLATALFVNDGTTLSEVELDLSELVFLFDFAGITPAECTGLEACDDTRRFLVASNASTLACAPSTLRGCKLASDAQLAGTLIVGDLDSDGLEDLGVVDLEGFQVFRQLSQSEAQQTSEE